MKYISTRGNAPELNFEDVLLTGLASDGGLYVPKDIPKFSADEIQSWAELPYHELAFKGNESYDEVTLKRILK